MSRVGRLAAAGGRGFGDAWFGVRDFVATKARLPVPDRGIVADVGSGSAPHFRAHVLIEKFPMAETGHRTGPTIQRRRQLLLIADAADLPVKDKAFAFVIASHVLEHVEHPDEVARELSRVAEAGYVECPAGWAEMLVPHPAHSWVVTSEGDSLRFTGKSSSAPGMLPAAVTGHPRIAALYRDRALWTVAVSWTGTLRVAVDGHADEARLRGDVAGHRRSAAVERAVGLLSAVLGRFYRPSPMSMERLIAALRCPRCGGDIRSAERSVVCQRCGQSFPFEDGVIDFLGTAAVGREES